MISTIRTSLIVLCLHIILGTIVYGASLPPQQDFQFETGTDEELQVVFTEPFIYSGPELVAQSQYLTYEKEYHKCPNGEDSILLTFVLKSQNWNNIGRDKKERAVLKLSKFFGIPKDLIKVENINRKDIYEIGKHSTQHGINYVEANKRLGKIEFLIGCGKSYFGSVESLIKQISDQMRDELIDDLTGFKFGWWAIWHQPTHSRRRRDNNLAEGSGDDNQVDDNDDYDDYEEDEYADVTTEVSSSPNAVANSDDSRPHRHHHGDNSQPDQPIEQPTEEQQTIDIPVIITDIPILINNQLIGKDSPLHHISKRPNEIDADSNTDDGGFVSPIESTEYPLGSDEDIKESVSKLESQITKTIENTNASLREVEEEIKELTEENEIKKAIVQEKLYEQEKDLLPIREVISDEDAHIVMIKTTLPPLTTFITDQLSIDLNGHVGNSDETELAKILEKEQESMKAIIKETDFLTPIDLDETDDMSTMATVSTKSLAAEREYTELMSIVTTTPEMVPTVPVTIVQTTETTESSSMGTNPTSSSTATSVTSHSMPTITVTNPSIEISTGDQSPTISSSLSTTLSSSPSSPPLSSSPSSVLTLTTNQNIIVNRTKTSQETDTIIVPQSTDKLPTTLDSIENEDDVVSNESKSESASSSRTPTEKVSETTESDYDYNYDEDEFKDVKPDVIVPSPGSDEAASEETIATTASQAPTTGSTTTERTTSTIIVTEPVSLNQSPMIRNRLQKLAITAGKWFTMTIPMDLFHDPEDGRDIRIVVLDDRGNELKSTSWLQFNPAKREIYGLPLEEDISKWQFQVKGIDSENLSVTETLDITVQHYKSFRSANHEIRTHVDLLNKFETPLNWQSRLLQSIADVSGDGSFDNIIVREIKMRDNQNAKKYYFVYSNETLPKDKCPDAELKQLIAKTNMDRLNGLLKGDIKIEKIEGNLIGQCAKSPEPTKHTVPHIGTKKNFAPVPRNQVDRVNAVALQLLVFKVPQDTFYDQEDLTDLKLSLLNQDGTPLDANHWLQFDSKNHEFFGVPKMSDIGSRDYILEAQDREGEKAMDALIVTVTYPSHRDPGATFEMELKMPVQQFDTASMQRRFIEQLGWLFNDQDTQDIQIVNIKEDAISKNVVISYHNTSLYRPYGVCPLEDINILKDVVLHRDGKIRERARSIFGNDLSLIRFNVNKRGPCDGEPIIHHEVTPIKNEDKKHKSGFSNDYLLTYVLPGVIILAMLLLAAIIACVLHKRKYSGKMELGSEEERKSFRSKGIPVIFQDELDEKPELGNKSPIILKDEKPPLLPPTYNQTNPDDEDNMDEYVPPPGVVSGGRESRGKSPITPSYRKPPPYVSP